MANCRWRKHKLAVRHRVETDRAEWGNVSNITGDLVKGSKWIKTTYVVIKECSRDGCKHREAYRMYTKSNEASEAEHIIEQIHPDLADELIFVDKI